MDQTTEIVIRQPDVSEDKTLSTGLIARSRSIEITSTEAVIEGDKLLIENKTLQKRITDRLNPLIDHAHKAHKGLCDIRKELIGPLLLAANGIQEKRRTFVEEAERLRLAKERELQEIARKKAEDERLAEAGRLEQEDRHEEAEQAVAAPVAIPVVIVPTSIPKTTGVTPLANWTYRIEDYRLIPRKYMMPDKVKIGARIRSMKLQSNIPGIKPYNAASVSVKTG